MQSLAAACAKVVARLRLQAIRADRQNDNGVRRRCADRSPTVIGRLAPTALTCVPGRSHSRCDDGRRRIGDGHDDVGAREPRLPRSRPQRSGQRSAIPATASTNAARLVGRAPGDEHARERPNERNRFEMFSAPGPLFPTIARTLRILARQQTGRQRGNGSRADGGHRRRVEQRAKLSRFAVRRESPAPGDCRARAKDCRCSTKSSLVPNIGFGRGPMRGHPHRSAVDAGRTPERAERLAENAAFEVGERLLHDADAFPTSGGGARSGWNRESGQMHVRGEIPNPEARRKPQSPRRNPRVAIRDLAVGAGI